MDKANLIERLVTLSRTKANQTIKRLTDIARLLEAYPYLRERVPDEILSKI